MAHSSLKHLSDKELLSALKDMTHRERALTVDVLLHLNEVEMRKLHLKFGYSSLFEYCTQKLRYSESAAGRRIQVARCLNRFPEIGDMVLAGELNLTTVSLVAKSLNRENATRILSQIRGKSQRQVERVVAAIRPNSQIRDRIRPVFVRVPTHAATTPCTPGAGSEKSPNRGPQGATVTAHNTDTPWNEPRSLFCKASTLPHKTVEKRLIQFAVGQEFMAKLDEMKAILSQKLPGASLEQVFDAAMNAYLDKHSPARREQRRAARDGKKTTPATAGLRSGKPVGSRHCVRRDDSAAAGHGDKRAAIPAALRDHVHTRDRGRCVYVGPSGKRCGATHNLQVDHIVPVGRGGSNQLSNLRLLCAKHNRFEAERVYGFDITGGYARRDTG